MDKEKLIRDTSIRAVKDIIGKGHFKWSDTGELITYVELLNVLGLKEPLSLNEARQVYLSLTNDIRITRV